MSKLPAQAGIFIIRRFYMNEMQVFQNQQFGEVRVIEEDGKVLFCGSDVARALGTQSLRTLSARIARVP